MLIIGKTWSKGEGKWELYAQFFCKSKTAQKKKKKKKTTLKFLPFHLQKRGEGEKNTMRFQKNGHMKCWQGGCAMKMFTVLVRMSNVQWYNHFMKQFGKIL